MSDPLLVRRNRQLSQAGGLVRQVGCLEASLGAPADSAVSSITLVCLHGWMDNAASFIPLVEALAPMLEQNDCHYRVLVLELAGHGYSSHKSDYYHLVDYVDDLHACLSQWQLGDVVLLGHSLGAIICTLYTSVFPEQVRALLCFDGLVPLTASPEQASVLLRESILARQARRERGPRQKPIRFSSLVRGRMQVSDLTEPMARLILRENVQPWGDGKDTELVTWRSDPKVQLVSPLRMHPEQADAVVAGLERPCWLFYDQAHTLPAKLLAHSCLAPVALDGGHYLHMTKVKELAPQVARALQSC